IEWRGRERVLPDRQMICDSVEFRARMVLSTGPPRHVALGGAGTSSDRRSKFVGDLYCSSKIRRCLAVKSEIPIRSVGGKMRRQPKLLLFGLSVTLAVAMTCAAFAAGTALIYVTNRGGTTIDVIDAATNKVVHTIGNIESPEVVRFSPDGRLLYIFSRTDPESNFLIVMDRKSEKIVKKVPLSGWANEAQTTKDGKLILVCIRNTGTKAEDTGALDIIDATTLEKVKSIPVRRGLHDLAVI